MIKLLSELGERDREQAGGKAYSQALLWQKGFQVPPGIVVSAEAFQYFLNETGLAPRLRELAKDPDRAGQLSKLIEQSTLPGTLAEELKGTFPRVFPEHYPHGFAVRSSALGEDSATHSFA